MASDEKKNPKDQFLKTERRDKGYTRAAQLLIVLGKEHAAKVLSHLSEEETLAITSEISRINAVTPDEAKKVLKDFGYLVKAKDLVARGGIEKAREMLALAFGPDKAIEYHKRLAEKTVPHPFAFLNDLKADALIDLIKDESGPVISMIFSHINPVLAARVLTALPTELKKQVAKRISGSLSIPPEVIRKTEEVLRNKIKLQGEAVSEEVNGKAALTEILKHLDPEQGNQILGDISESLPEVAKDIGKRLFSLDIVYRVTKRDLQKVLREVPDIGLAKLIKAKDEDFKERLLSCVSRRRADIIKADSQAIRTMLKSEMEKTESGFLGLAREMLERGEITLLSNDDLYIE